MRHSVSKHWMRYGLILIAGMVVAVGCEKKSVTGVAPNYTLSLAPAALTIVQGGNGAATVTITRTNFTDAVTLSLDGAPAGVTGTFAPAAPTGTTSTLTVTVGGAVALGTYSLTVNGTGTPGNRSTALTLTVTVPTVSFTAAAQTVSEGVGTATITAQLSSSSSQAVTVPFTVSGTATSPADYTISASPLTIPAGSTTGTITVTVVADGVAEPDETVIVTLGTPTNATLGATTVHTVTITGQVPTVSFTAAAQSVSEGVGTATITAQLSSSSSQAVTVPFTVSGTATSPADYTISASPLTIPAGSTTGTITVTVVADGVAEPDETVIVTLGTPTNATLGATTVHTVTIAAQVPTVSFTAAAQTVSEGVGTATITAQLSSSSSQAVTVPFTVGGTATSPADYTITASPLTIAAGSTTGTITVTVVADAVAEPDETVIVTLGTPTNATLGATTVHTLTVTGSGGGGGNVTVSFAGCAIEDKAVWLAYKDGSGAWVRATAVSDVYSFTIASSTGGIAYVLDDGNQSGIFVHYMTQAELTAGTLTFCGAAPTTRTITGTAANLGVTEAAHISLGGGFAMVIGAIDLNFSISGVLDGTHDLVGFKSDQTAPGAERALLRRDVMVSGNGSVGTVDFAGSESFAAASATITVGGLLGSETDTIQTMSYRVGAACEAASLGFGGPIASGSFTAFGIPGGQQRITDYHNVTISASTGTTQFRSVSESFHTLGARTVTLGAALPSPVIADLGGPYKRLSATFTLPADYQTQVLFDYSDAATPTGVTLSASFGFLGGSSVSLGLDDFSGLTGWNNTWVPAAGGTGNWDVTATGSTGGSTCTENARTRFANRSGNY
ncbi:MAG TPA: Calx-beta domain-containing protein [Gemmatimonadales bacterium]|nr:Calx-beta domain-containing protein [Gemmatimonadales bacterium]